MRKVLFWALGLWFCFACNVSGQTITSLEYFVDADPGVGLGTPLSITPADSIDRTFNLSGGAVSEGIHVLGMRAKARGRWGVATSRWYMVVRVPATQGPAPRIAAGEYFIDTDPGPGNGIRIAAVPNADSVDVNLSVPVAVLSDGIHTLGVRFKDAGGTWGVQLARVFWIIRTPIARTKARLSRAEWFIDTDPGPGRATRLPSAIVGDSALFTASAGTSGLQPGYHTFGIRMADSLGRWGAVRSSPFFILSASQANSRRGLAKAEYFLDGRDPGPGRATRVIGFTPGAEVDIIRGISMTGLSLGDHRLSLRIADSSGRWTPLQTRTFTITRPRLTAIAPSAVGNIGTATLRITGEAFTDSTRLRLVPTFGGRAPIVLDTGLVQTEGRNLLISFDFNGLDTGTFNLEATFRGRPDTVIVLARAFRIEGGRPPLVTAELITYPAIRINTWTPFQVVIQNQGNIDARSIPVVIQLPEGAEVRWGFYLKAFGSRQSLIDSLQPRFQFARLDSALNSTTTINGVAMWLLPVVRAGETMVFSFHGKMPASAATNNRMAAYALAPLMGSSQSYPEGKSIENASPAGLGCLTQFADSECQKKQAELAIDAISAIPALGGPAAACAFELVSTVACTIIDAATANPEGDRKPADYLSTYGLALFSCIPGSAFSNRIEAVIGISEIIVKIATAGVNGYKAGSIIQSGFGGTPGPCPPPPPTPPNPKTPRIAGSFDPNDKLGTTGNNRLGYTQTNAKFPYLIRFENLRTATAPAATVTINDTLDTRVFDPATIELGYVGFGDTIIIPPTGLNRWKTEVSLAPIKPYVIRISAGYNPGTRVLSWYFETLDQTTLEPVFGADDGFLPPNQNSPEGEGAVFFTIGVRPNLPVGTVIKNRASIIFDNNAQILTPAWVNRVDNIVPQSRVTTLPDSSSDRFILRWAGSDQGSGISKYSIFFKVNDGKYRLWKTTDSTTGIFVGQLDSTYSFYSVALDSAGNMEQPPAIADASTRVSGVDKAEVSSGLRVTIAPNPNTGQFSLLHNEIYAPLPYHVYDAQGRLLLSGALVPGSRQSDISMSLLPGMYYVRVQNNRGVVFRRFIVR